MAKSFFGVVGLAAALIVAALGSITASDNPPALNPSPPAYLDIVDAELEVDDDEVEMELRLAGDAAGGVPGNAYGYAALTSDGTGILAVTTHIGIEDTSAELDETGFHTHVAAVTTVTGCASGLQVASASFDPIGELEVDGAEVEVEDAPSDDLGAFTGFFVSFTLTVEGGAICVNPADVFPEDLCGQTITQDLELDRDLSCAGDGLTVGASGVTIKLRGHTIAGPGGDFADGPGLAASDTVGIYVMPGLSDVVIKGPGTVTMFDYGVLVHGSTDVVVKKITATHNGEAGIGLEDASHVLVKDNVATGSHHDGIQLFRSHDNVIKENWAVDNRGAANSCGINLMDSDDNRVEENVVARNTLAGIQLNGADGNSIEENEVSETGGGPILSTGGLRMVGTSTGNTFEENEVEENTNGVSFVGSLALGNTFEENEFEENVCGVKGSAAAIAGNTFEDNEFEDNGSDFCP